MPVGRRVNEQCRCCGDDSDVWLVIKHEPTVVKEQYTCKSCGCEWTERRRKG